MPDSSPPTWLQSAEEHLIRYCKEFSPILIDRAEGAYIYDKEGRAILDFTSGQMCSIVGHNHPKVKAAIHSAGDQSLSFAKN